MKKVSCTVAAILLTGLTANVPAQVTEPAPRLPDRAQAVDAGDFYRTPDGYRRILRAPDRVVIRETGKNSRASSLASLKKGSALTRGAFTESNAGRSATILRYSESAASNAPIDLTGHLQTLDDARRKAGHTAVDPVFVDPDSGLFMIPNQEIVVCLLPGVRPDDLFGGTPVTVRRIRGTSDQYLITLRNKTAEETIELVNKLADAEGVKWAEPNFLLETRKQSNDPLFSSQWHLHNTGSDGKKADSDVNAPEAWLIVTGTPSVVVAVLDDGVDILHEDLVDAIFNNADEVAANGIDDDTNGYTDDVNGWDFLDADGDPAPSTNDRHGTAVAGIVAATADNGVGVAGIAGGCKILPIRCFDPFVPGNSVAEAILYAGSFSVAINMSYTFPRTTAVGDAIDNVVKNGRSGSGCAVFAPTGNNGSGILAYPARHADVFSVGASTAWDVRPSYSQYGSGIDFVAPGGNTLASIVTTDRSGGFGYESGGYTYDFVGTSASSPLAAGIAALVFSRYPTMTLGELETVLKGTCAKIGGVTYDSAGWNQYYGYGRLDARKAVAGECPASMVSILSPPDQSTVATRTPLLTWEPSLRATWYQLWINRNGTTFFKTWMQTTSWQVPSALAHGTYTWRVKAWNRYGSEWSASSVFTVPPVVTGKAALLGPSGIVQPPGPVNFTWAPVDDATWYQFWLNRDGRKLQRNWIQDTQYVTNDLPFGLYQWWVQTYGIDGPGPWSDPMSFTYGMCVLLAPQGDLGGTTRPAFTWRPVNQATWYNIYLQKDGAFYLSQWIQTDAKWTPETPLPAGDYAWWVRPWNSKGYGKWSASMDFRIVSP